MTNDELQRLLLGNEMEPEEERLLIDGIAAGSPRSMPGVAQVLANHRRQLRAELGAERTARQQLERLLAELREPPWFPADVLRVLDGGRFEVVVTGRRQIVRAAPDVDWTGLRPGDEVLLGREQNAALARGDAGARAGVVGTVIEATAACVVVHGLGDEEIVVTCAREIAERLEAGDRVLYHRDSHCVLERLAERAQSPFLLEHPPATTFANLGGFDAVIADIRRDLDLHLFRPDLVGRYHLRPLTGITLAGPPGVGKTTLTGALAHHVQQARGETRLLYVKPGALRGVYYGQAENNIRELFRVARAAPGQVIIFFDEVDTFGARGTSIGHTIDDRVMSALLVELSGLEPGGRILCVAATNRLDLCDQGLLRPGRFGDRVYVIPRPDRAAARQILAKYLTADLPYAPAGDGAARAAACVDAAVAHLYDAHGGAGTLATVTLLSGDRLAVTAAHVMSGALVASAVERAKHAAAERHTDADGGLAVEDLLDALDRALVAETEKLRLPHAARRILDLPRAEEIIRVEVPARRPPPRHRYLRAVAV